MADIQAWSGLTGLGEVVGTMRAGLAVFADERGRTLYDLPDWDRPDPGVPVPVRFLPDYDNVLLAHADRSRIATEPWLRSRSGPRNGQLPGTVLVDGLTAANWTISREKGRATITVEPFARLSRGEADAIGEEARQLLAFTDPGATQDIRLLADGG